LQECFISDILLKNKFNIQLEVLVDLNNGLREQCFVLSPRQFVKESVLDEDYNGYKVLTSDPNYYYKYASFTILRNYSTLYISIKFPITTHGKLFQTYNVSLIYNLKY
jgi:hypothetical protein